MIEIKQDKQCNTEQLAREINAAYPKWVGQIRVRSARDVATQAYSTRVYIPDSALAADQRAVEQLMTNHVMKSATQLRDDKEADLTGLITKLTGLGLTNAEIALLIN